MIAKLPTQEELLRGWKSESPVMASICCITYNQEAYLHNAINSFLMQKTSFPFEILLHDDASTDSTVEIILEYARLYPKIIKPILQNENQYSKGGLIYLRFVFPKTQGKYIALCEGDDYWTDYTKLQKQVIFLEAHPDHVITYSDCQPFDENGALDTQYSGSKRDLTSLELKKATAIFTLTACFRNVLKSIPPDLMSARYGDLVMWSLLGAHGKGKYLSDVKPAAYRVHSAGVHSNKSKLQQKEMLLMTNNALFAYYSRKGEMVLARHFREVGLLLSMKIIGLRKLIPLVAKALAKLPLNRLRSKIG